MKTLFSFWKFLVAGLAFAAISAFAQTAQVVDLTGTATARVVPAAAPGQPAPTPGAARNLRTGDAVNAGETISTGPNSRLALRFDDGQLVSLTSNSSFRIDTYTYNRTEPERSSVLLSLLSGGMRAITGAIGKARPQAVAYRAGNATIGIRGTDVTFAIAGGNLIVNVSTGQISFVPSSGAAPVSVTAGNGVFSNSQTGMVSVGNATAVAQAIQQAIAASPAQAAALGTLAAAVVNVSPANSPLANAVTSAVAASGSQAAQQSFNSNSSSSTSTSPPQTQSGPTTTSASGQVNPGASAGSSGAGGGGSTLPLCSSIISPVVANPGVNCRTS